MNTIKRFMRFNAGNTMRPDDKTKKEQEVERRIIFEMINASIDLAEKIGPHDLTKGCNCITCVNKRKQIIYQDLPEWKYVL